MSNRPAINPTHHRLAGFSLIEAMVALIILAGGLLALARFHVEVITTAAEAKALKKQLPLREKEYQSIQQQRQQLDSQRSEWDGQWKLLLDQCKLPDDWTLERTSKVVAVLGEARHPLPPVCLHGAGSPGDAERGALHGCRMLLNEPAENRLQAGVLAARIRLLDEHHLKRWSLMPIRD